MLNNVRLKTCVVPFSLEASTVEAINAALVDNDAGNLYGAKSDQYTGRKQEASQQRLMKPT